MDYCCYTIQQVLANYNFKEELKFIRVSLFLSSIELRVLTIENFQDTENIFLFYTTDFEFEDRKIDGKLRF